MKNMFDLADKVAVVTGASSGLGVQYAKLLTDNGADLAILARHENKLEEVKKEIIAMGRKCEAYHCDVS